MTATNVVKGKVIESFESAFVSGAIGVDVDIGVIVESIGDVGVGVRLPIKEYLLVLLLFVCCSIHLWTQLSNPVEN